MQHESELTAFLHEVLAMRAENRGTNANQLEDFIRANKDISDFVASVTDEEARAMLLKYEDLQSNYNSLLMPYMYMEGMKDGAMLLKLVMQYVLFQN